MRRDRLLAVNSNPKPGDLPGQETREPAFDSPGEMDHAGSAGAGHRRWIRGGGSHFGACGASFRAHQAECARSADSRTKPSGLSTGSPTRIRSLIDELIPKLMTLGEVQKVLQQLLREQVSIRDLGTILETLVETAANQQESGPACGSGAARTGTRVDSPAAGRERPAESGDARQLDRRGVCAFDDAESADRLPAERCRFPWRAGCSTDLRAMLGDQVAMAPPVLLCSSPGGSICGACWSRLFPRLL